MTKLISRTILALSLFVLAGLQAVAQTAASTQEQIPMADQLRSDGKIYVVVAVFVMLIAGVLAYLIRLDAKIRRLEKQHS